MTFSIMTLSINTFSIMVKKHDTQDSGSVVMLSVTYKPVMHRVMMPNVIMLCVMSPNGMLCSHFTKIVSCVYLPKLI